MYTAMTKEWAIDQIIERLEKKWPGCGATERTVLEKRSRASLLHSVGGQWYGDLNQIDQKLMEYACSQMTDAEQRTINEAG